MVRFNFIAISKKKQIFLTKFILAGSNESNKNEDLCGTRNHIKFILEHFTSQSDFGHMIGGERKC